MFQEIMNCGTRSVCIMANDAAGPFSARLWVNCTGAEPSQLGDVTLKVASRKTLKAARQWAEKTLHG